MSWILKDEVLIPHEESTLSYAGVNPFQAYSLCKRLFEVVLRAKGKDIYEDEFCWDTTADPRFFSVKFRVEIGYDTLSKGIMYVGLKGEQPTDPAKTGKVTLTLRSELLTTYPTQGLKKILLPFFWLYNSFFYFNQRRKYIQGLRDLSLKFVSELKARLGLK